MDSLYELFIAVFDGTIADPIRRTVKEQYTRYRQTNRRYIVTKAQPNSRPIILFTGTLC